MYVYVSAWRMIAHGAVMPVAHTMHISQPVHLNASMMHIYNASVHMGARKAYALCVCV